MYVATELPIRDGHLTAHDLTTMKQSAILYQPTGHEGSAVADICPRNAFLALGWPDKFSISAIHLECSSVSTVAEQTVIESPEVSRSLLPKA